MTATYLRVDEDDEIVANCTRCGESVRTDGSWYECDCLIAHADDIALEWPDFWLSGAS